MDLRSRVWTLSRRSNPQGGLLLGYSNRPVGWVTPGFFIGGIIKGVCIIKCVLIKGYHQGVLLRVYQKVHVLLSK